MTKAAAPQKDDATARLKLGSIVRKTARVVGYITLALGIGAVVASCQSNASNCTAPGVVCDF